MYKKLGNYNNYNNYSNFTLNVPIIRANKNKNPSYILDTYNSPITDDKVSCDSIITGKDENGIKTLQPNDEIQYFSEKEVKSKMKCIVDPKTNAGSIKCYTGMSKASESDLIKCCPRFSKEEDIPIIIGAVSSAYKDVHDALKKSNDNSVTADDVNLPQCVNLNPSPSPLHCCGVIDENGNCSPRGNFNGKTCECDQGFRGDNCEVVVPIKNIKSLKVPHHRGYDGYNGCASLVVCPYGLERLVPSKAGDYWKTGCLHGQIPTKLDVFGDYKNCYVIHQGDNYGPDCRFTGHSKAGTEYDIKVQQNFCSSEAGDITTNATNYKSETGSWWDSYGGGIVIGPKITPIAQNYFSFLKNDVNIYHFNEVKVRYQIGYSWEVFKLYKTVSSSKQNRGDVLDIWTDPRYDLTMFINDKQDDFVLITRYNGSNKNNKLKEMSYISTRGNYDIVKNAINTGKAISKKDITWGERSHNWDDDYLYVKDGVLYYTKMNTK